LTGSSLAAADRLFMTLDPAARLVSVPPHAAFVLTDTVGFIKKLPHQLVAAFKATLEELAEADVLVHVVDAAILASTIRRRPWRPCSRSSTYRIGPRSSFSTRPIGWRRRQH
jgi:50S ribosomal subunit-associated GTPase HflX